MKWLCTWLPFLIIALLLFILLLFTGCSLFQMSPADKIASLPETPQQQLFQTLAKTNRLFTLSIVGVGAGFFAFLNGSSKGLQFMAACFIVIILIIGLTRYSAWIAVTAMIGIVCLMIYSVLVKNKALREIVQGVEEARHIVLEGDEIYPENKMLKVLSNTQSKTTKALVKKVKKNL